MTNLFGTRPTDNLNAAGTLVVEEQIATESQTVITLLTFNYAINTSTVILFINGIKQKRTIDYTETSGTTLTLTTALVAGDAIAVLGFPLADYFQAGVGNVTTDIPTVGIVQQNTYVWAGTSSGTDTITASVTPAPTTLTSGMEFNFIAGGTTTTSTPTLNFNSLGAKNIVGPAGASLGAGDIVVGAVAKVIYDGTKFQLTNPKTSASYSSASGNVAIGTADIWGAYVDPEFGPQPGYNIGIGPGVLAAAEPSNTIDNIGIGGNALSDLTTGRGNVAVGTNAGGIVTTGFNNLLLNTTGGVTTGSANVVLGYNSTASSDSVNHEVTLGDPFCAALRCAVTTITAVSDARDKKDISSLDSAKSLELINTITPVEFTWDYRNLEAKEINSGKVGIKDTGFIAQDLELAQKTVGLTIPELVYYSNPERLEAGYSKLLPVLVAAIKELSAQFQAYKDSHS